MKSYLRILSYIKPYWFYAVLNLFFNICVILFSLFTFALLVPFLSLLFGKTELVTEAPEFAFKSDSLIEQLNYFLSKIIIEQGQMQALMVICLISYSRVYSINCKI